MYVYTRNEYSVIISKYEKKKGKRMKMRRKKNSKYIYIIFCIVFDWLASCREKRALGYMRILHSFHKHPESIIINTVAPNTNAFRAFVL